MSKPQSPPAPDEAGLDQRAALTERLNLAGREVSAATIMFHTAVALRRGLSATEEKTLDILLRAGPMTHAELGTATGLAPASVSGLIDRLEHKGYARRTRHPRDARRVLISANADRIEAELTPLFTPWAQSLAELYASYTTSQLETICDFMIRAAARQRDAAAALAAPAAGPGKPRAGGRTLNDHRGHAPPIPGPQEPRHDNVRDTAQLPDSAASSTDSAGCAR